MRQFLKEQRDLFDFIILDCPPALGGGRRQGERP
jgi:hypothetical protein